MSQPKWKLLGNLGDASPLDHGGYFVYQDETGVYDPEAEVLLLDDEGKEDSTYTIHRVVLERCTYVNGILSDNKFHPDYAAWFASPEAERAKRPQDTTYLSNVAQQVGIELNVLEEYLCSEDVMTRAEAYYWIGDYHGWRNFDDYPLIKVTREEAEKRYKEKGQS